MFNQSKHILRFSDQQLDEFFSPILTKFEASPFVPLSNLPMFNGSGVYQLFLNADSKTIYKGFVEYDDPIYVGKATQKGGRQGQAAYQQRALRSRLLKHTKSIDQVDNLNVSDFLVKFLIVDDRASALISAIEGYLIKELKPIWNSFVDGFGNNAPGAGRYNQSPSDWDTLHKGRYYAAQLTGEPKDYATVLSKLDTYKSLRGR